jgi:hypothetical protein
MTAVAGVTTARSEASLAGSWLESEAGSTTVLHRVGDGAHHLEGGPAELAGKASVPTPDAVAVVLIHKTKRRSARWLPASSKSIKLVRTESGRICILRCATPSNTFQRERLMLRPDWTTLPYWVMWVTSQLMFRAWLQKSHNLERKSEAVQL